MAGIYIHIPFCRKACTYCNFHFSTSMGGKEELLQALLLELESRSSFLEAEEVSTIYLGGGTPSLLSAAELHRLFDTIFRHYPVSNLEECTLEANPDDLNKQYLRDLAGTPVNRLSIGVQSFFDRDLEYMKRAHNASQSEYAIKAAQDKGFTNISIDLIYGTPGLTDKDWQYNLCQVQEMDIPHLSAYALTVEEGTALHHNIRKKKVLPLDQDQAATQFEILMETAPAMGLEHYEISNLARPGSYARHNTNYWKGIPYLGIGPSAHSFRQGRRSYNLPNNALYTRDMLAGRLSQEEELLTPVQQLNEYLMTSLRTQWGCDLDLVGTRWGTYQSGLIKEDSQPFIEKGWLSEEKNILKLNNAGKLFADHIAAELFREESV